MLIDNQSTALPRLFSPCLIAARRLFIQTRGRGHGTAMRKKSYVRCMKSRRWRRLEKNPTKCTLKRR